MELIELLGQDPFIEKTWILKTKGCNMLKSLTTALMLAATSAIAQEAPAAGQAQNPMMQFLPLVLVFVVFYFMMIRPQKKKFEQEQDLLSKLAKGDEVYTKSGIIGTIHGLTDTVITLDLGNGVLLKVLKSQIGGLYKSLTETK